MKFISKNQLLLLTAVVLFSFLGCVAVDVGPIPEGSSLFQKGYKDGANSGLVAAGNKHNKWTQDHKLISSDIDYKRGWEEGFFKNIGELKTSEKTDRAIRLLNLDNKIYEAEIINYFSLKPHKAFAINPLNHKIFYWCYDYNSTSSATSRALKKCGTLCALFAEEGDIVWEEKLEEWEKKYIEDKNNCNYSAKKNASDVIFYLTRVFGKSLLFEFSFQTQLYSHHI
ncbi:MAG: hypothetical protein PF690_09350, partial [Deltaproteobacteria bacterium]|nr:hypothetical protein [Deltaproteobacteria bacterium]